VSGPQFQPMTLPPAYERAVRTGPQNGLPEPRPYRWRAKGDRTAHESAQTVADAAWLASERAAGRSWDGWASGRAK
jgi:hypothetical protein